MASRSSECNWEESIFWRSCRAHLRSDRGRMRLAFVRCAYLRRRALRCVDPVEILLQILNLAIANDEAEIVLIRVTRSLADC